MGMLVIRKDGSQGKALQVRCSRSLSFLSWDTNGTNPHIVDLVVALILVVKIPDMFEQGKSSVARGAFINMDSC